MFPRIIREITSFEYMTIDLSSQVSWILHFHFLSFFFKISSTNSFSISSSFTFLFFFFNNKCTWVCRFFASFGFLFYFFVPFPSIFVSPTLYYKCFFLGYQKKKKIVFSLSLFSLYYFLLLLCFICLFLYLLFIFWCSSFFELCSINFFFFLKCTYTIFLIKKCVTILFYLMSI